MSSDFYAFDGSFFDAFPPFPASPIDVLQSISDDPLEETTYLDQIIPSIFSTSPPSYQLQNLSLHQTTHLQEPPNSAAQVPDFASLHVKTEDCPVPVLPAYGFQSFGPAAEAKMMQRSFSSNSFDGKPGFSFQPCFDSLVEPLTFHPQVMSSPENNFSGGQMRKVCSTGREKGAKRRGGRGRRGALI